MPKRKLVTDPERVGLRPSTSPFLSFLPDSLEPFGYSIELFPPDVGKYDRMDAMTYGMSYFPPIEFPRLSESDYGSLFPGFLTPYEFDDALKDVTIAYLHLTPSCFVGDRFLYADLIDYCKDHGITLAPFVTDSDYALRRYSSIYPSAHVLTLDMMKSGSSPTDKVQCFLSNRYLSFIEGTDYAEVRKSFSRRGFLSYRKTNRDKLDDVLALLKEKEELRHCVLWFDEMLTPTEIYEEEIRAAIDEADAVVFLITKEAFEENNYVRDVEFPYAKEQGKAMVALCVEDVDLLRLQTYFPGIPLPINIVTEKEKALEALCQVFGDPDWNPTPKRLYHIGFAYAHGYLVHRDDELALDYFKKAGDAGYLRAFLAAAELTDGTDKQNRYYDMKYADSKRHRFRQEVKKMSEEEKLLFFGYGNPPQIMGAPAPAGNGHKVPKEVAMLYERALKGEIIGEAEIPSSASLAEAQEILGLPYLFKGDYEKARACYEIGEDSRWPYRGIKPENARAYYHRVLTLIELGDEEALTSKPVFPSYYFPVSICPSAVPILELYSQICEAYDVATNLMMWRRKGLTDEEAPTEETTLGHGVIRVRRLACYGRLAYQTRLELLLALSRYAILSRNAPAAELIHGENVLALEDDEASRFYCFAKDLAQLDKTLQKLMEENA